jgi:hypothetical protein
LYTIPTLPEQTDGTTSTPRNTRTHERTRTRTVGIVLGGDDDTVDVAALDGLADGL